MKDTRRFRVPPLPRTIGVHIIGVLAFVLVASLVFGHGGKDHGSEFTALKALQEATKLYDSLIENKKIDESWETDLKKAEISTRMKDDKKEIVVSFYRSQGDPSTVYIFFSYDGKYAGSSFTGE